jgi:hypothetical protein
MGVPLGRGEEVVERVSLGGGTRVGAGAIDVTLRGNHGLVAEELHQCVDADIGVGEFGGEGMSQAMCQGAGRSFAVDASFLEGTQDPILQCSARDPLSVCSEK